VAADVHGKNHTSTDRSPTTCAPCACDARGDVSGVAQRRAGTILGDDGAMGLTGVVTSVELGLTSVETNQMIVDTDRFDDLESVMSEMRVRDSDYRYSVAWVDCMTRARQWAGRS